MARNLFKTTPAQIPQPSAAPSPCLVHIYPPGAAMGRRYSCGMNSITIGRSEECEINTPDTSISRQHARIERSANGYLIMDLGSTNGTFVNNRPIPGPLALRDGDYVRIGNCVYRFLAGGNIELQYHEEIHRLTILDGLTQIHNRRSLLEFLDTEVSRAQRYDRPFSLLMLDIDKFKSINDTLGHLGGDHVLRELSARIRPTIRKGDLFARYGGEEFAVALVETAHDQALDAAERLRSLVADHRMQFGGQTVNATISIGLVGLEELSCPTPTLLLETADRRLYRAKELGRNRVVSGIKATVGC